MKPNDATRFYFTLLYRATAYARHMNNTSPSNINEIYLRLHAEKQARLNLKGPVR